MAFLWPIVLALVDDAVLARIATRGSADVMIHLAAPLSLDTLELDSSLPRTFRREAVHRHLLAQAEASQEGMRTTLARLGVPFTPFWISNAIAVRPLPAAALQALTQAHAAEIARIKLIGMHRRLGPTALRQAPLAKSVGALGEDAQWNIKLVAAPEAWAAGANGSGVVVATLDGGVSYKHEALVDGYRGSLGGGKYSHDYNWKDWPYKHKAPDDDDGHGTNVQGIATASRGYGVAPGARWFTGKIFNFAGYSADDWTLGGCQFAMCPTPVDATTPENCSLGADVVSNSWGEDDATTDFLKPVVAAWLKAGIVPVFAVGNAGPTCSTSVSPSDYAGVLAVGATDHGDQICPFSSRGPAANGTSGPIPYSPLAPSIVAPGLSIAGPSYKGEGYTDFSGTSQAAPHVAGAAAVLLSASPSGLDGPPSPAEVAAALYKAAATASLKEPDRGKDTCGNVAWSTFPNFIYGNGRLDVYAALAEMRSSHTLG